MSSRQRFRPANDIFDMISENDEDIRFDECGILKPVTATKSTIVVSSDDYPHSPTPEGTPVSDSDKIYCGPKR
ncbi:unnamed protein product [Adineta ricciae]|uniref:Uncharacterized protein n=1 Tax=Adineta ricciae TaxID=249248 RepID=A0A815QKV9_ADIRI|nr:unnamed protein product [Adineta ricciae]